MTVGIIAGNIKAVGTIPITIDPLAAAADSSSETDITVPGLEIGDFVWVNKPTLQAAFGISNVRVKAANTLSVQFLNVSASSINAGAQTYVLFWARRDGEVVNRVLGA